MDDDRARNRLKVSFVIPCYNGRQYLDECLGSIQRLALSSCEAIVVDDGSTEEFRDVVARYSSFARYVRQDNQGPAVARNRGIQEASGEYVHFLDADDFLISPEGTRLQLAMLENYPEMGLVYAQARKIDSQGRPCGARTTPFAQTSYCHAGIDELSHLLLGNYITTSTTIVRRRVLEHAGPFRPELFGPEDWDCWLRIARVSSIGYLAEPVVAYRIHEKSITAGYSAEPWLRTHYEIVDRAFADPLVAQRYGPMRERIQARLYYQAATLTYMNGHMKTSREYARNAMRHLRDHRVSRDNLGCASLIVKSYVPATVRPLLRQISRRGRIAVAALRLSPGSS